MELALVSESITSLLTVKEYINKISDLEQQVSTLTSDFQVYKIKVKSSIKSIESQYSQKLQLKQHEIEKLQMQNAELESVLMAYMPKVSESKKSETSQIQQKFLEIIKNQNIWATFKSYLNSKDLLKMLKTPELKSCLLEDQDLFEDLTQLMATPVVLQVDEEKLAVHEQQDVNILLEKYVKQQYVIGKGIEKKLTDAMPTLIRLFKSSGNNMPNQKFNSVAELILNVFPFDIMLEVFIKSSSAFSKNAGSLNEWLSFMQNLLAGLICESALAFNEVSELTKLKNVLVDRLRKAKDQLKHLERENVSIKSEVKTLKDVKDHLVSRLHNTDISIIEKTKTIEKFKEDLNKTQKNMKDLEDYIELLKKSEIGKIDKMNSQIEVYKSHIDILNMQKKELITAFEDLGTVFKSFGLKFS